MGKARGLVRLMRPVNCVMIGFAVLVGAALAGASFLSSYWLRVVYGFITGFALTAASMVINDYYDRRIDLINEPKRPIPSGLVSPKEALVFASVLTAAGFIFAFINSYQCLAVALISWVFLATYTTAGKRSGLPGNFLVSACVAIPFIYGSVTVVGYVPENVLLFASLAFLSNTGREITKGIVDVVGDKNHGVKTLAVRFGEKKAAITAVLFYVLAIGLSAVPWFLGLVSFWFLPFVSVIDVGLVASSFILLRAPSRENAKKIKNLVLVLFVFGLLAFIFGTLR
jgi:geranylgeranylglycerol-phosphate geranylgeranyltransferase